jgi:hypothetical protein
MTEKATTGMSRRHLLEAAGTAAAAIAAVGLAGAAEASPPAPESMPFKGTVVIPVAQIKEGVIPFSPPLATAIITGTGQADLLGQVTYVDHHTLRLGVDGMPKSLEGEGAMTAANGDALFFTWRGLFNAATGRAEDVFFITGGTGQFCGATGSGALTTVRDDKQGTFTWDGMIQLPKK